MNKIKIFILLFYSAVGFSSIILPLNIAIQRKSQRINETNISSKDQLFSLQDKPAKNTKAEKNTFDSTLLPICLPIVPILSEIHLHINTIKGIWFWFSTHVLAQMKYAKIHAQYLPNRRLHPAFVQLHNSQRQYPVKINEKEIFFDIRHMKQNFMAVKSPSESLKDAETRRDFFVKLGSKVAIIPCLLHGTVVSALKLPERDIRKDYDGFAKNYDELDGGAAASALGIPDLRKQLISSASGRVLEIAVGTGLNMASYDISKVSKLDAIDLSPGMLTEAMKAAEQNPGLVPKISFHEMNVEALEFPNDSFDTVVDTFSLCVFRNPVAALQEMGRVCKPGGQILLLENNRADNNLIGSYQDFTAPLVAQFGGKGCFYNQDVSKLAQKANLEIVRSEKVLGGVFALVEATPQKVS